ncbi:hypothetical protein Syun_011871 [Stephania yunnanensis]|uniref:Uncharacterized protein n=1 Tax=Stephania yunnanensis TaxID=152371 RepID=A0AAP0JYK0_9MAGN
MRIADDSQNSVKEESRPTSGDHEESGSEAATAQVSGEQTEGKIAEATSYGDRRRRVRAASLEKGEVTAIDLQTGEAATTMVARLAVEGAASRSERCDGAAAAHGLTDDGDGRDEDDDGGGGDRAATVRRRRFSRGGKIDIRDRLATNYMYIMYLTCIIFRHSDKPRSPPPHRRRRAVATTVAVAAATIVAATCPSSATASCRHHHRRSVYWVGSCSAGSIF